MIRVICPNCRAKLNAKDELVGQTRKCPGCGAPVVIQPAEPAPPARKDAPAAAPAAPAADEPVDAPGRGDSLLRLERLNRYMICDGARVLATWEHNGQGWRIRTDHGFASAARNPEKIPAEGDFKLVELKMATLDNELRLQGIQIYRLARRWSLKGLARGDDAICKSIVGPGALLRAQKDAVRLQLQDLMMRTIWGDAAEVLDYLSNDDYHSHSAGA